MYKGIVFLLAAVLLTSFWMVLENSPELSAAEEVSPDFPWHDMQDVPHRLSEWKGKPVVLHFWASWCAPCIEEFPQFVETARKNSGIIFIAATDDEDKKQAEAFLRKHAQNPPANLLFANDGSHALAFDTFQTAVYPETLLLDGNHHLLRKFPGPVDWSAEDVQDILNRLR